MCRCSSAFERACADAHPVQTKPRPREPLSLPTQPNQDLANCTERFMCARSLAVFLTREACPPKCKLCLGGARRRNICAPRPILDGRRLGNHPFYRCPLKDSCAHAAPECRARPRRRRPSRPGSAAVAAAALPTARAGKAVAAAALPAGHPSRVPPCPRPRAPARLSVSPRRRFRPGIPPEYGCCHGPAAALPAGHHSEAPPGRARAPPRPGCRRGPAGVSPMPCRRRPKAVAAAVLPAGHRRRRGAPESPH